MAGVSGAADEHGAVDERRVKVQSRWMKKAKLLDNPEIIVQEIIALDKDELEMGQQAENDRWLDVFLKWLLERGLRKRKLEDEELEQRRHSRAMEQLRARVPPATALQAAPVELVFEHAVRDDGNEFLRYPSLFKAATKDPGPHYTLLLRKCYGEISSLAMEPITSKAKDRVVVLGNPGIGKSGLLVAEAYRQAMASKKTYVVFRQEEAGKGRNMVVLDSVIQKTEEAGKTTVKFAGREGTRQDFASELVHSDSTDAIILVDGSYPPFQTSFPTILYCSPDEGNYHEWSKNASVLYMEVWSEAELAAANDFIFKVDADELERRRLEWGPVPLLLFNNPGRATEGYFNAGISKMLKGGLQSLCDRDSHRIVKLVPTPDRRDYTYAFLSNPLYLRFCKQLFDQGREEVNRFLHGATSSLFSGLRGKIAEYPMHLRLSVGGKFEVKRLFIDGSVELGELSLKRMPLELLSRATTVEPGKYYLPRADNNGCWDGYWISDDGTFYFTQVTFSTQHQKKLEFLLNEKNRRNKSNQPAVMCFVLPKEKFEVFEFQKWLNHAGKVDQTPHDEIPQYAISIDLKELDKIA